MMEREADEVGLILMARACFDPALAPAYYASVKSVDESAEWGATHPADSKRAENAARGAETLAAFQKHWCAGDHGNAAVATSQKGRTWYLF